MANLRLEDLIQWYMRQYAYSRHDAIVSIIADLRDILKTES